MFPGHEVVSICTMPTHTENDVLLTLAISLAAGVILVAVARKTSFSAIAFLLIGGVLLGPTGLGIVKPESLGSTLRPLISLAVGLILFEGGLTLDLGGYRSASRVIIRLLTVGVLVTWWATALAIHLLFDYSLSFSLLAASLVIVTGPTVIVPLLKRIKVQQPLHSILHWEGVLIDPIGVFVAILCFEWISGLGAQSAATNFALRVLMGLLVGGLGGLSLAWLIRRRVIHEDLIDIVPVAVAVLAFVVGEVLMSESGLLATATAGFTLGASQPSELRQIRRFKAGLTDLLIGFLFVVLAARLRTEQFVAFGWAGVWVVVLVLFVIRPLNVLASTLGEPIGWRHRAFLSWVAPRGIVAASMSSLFALNLRERGVADARFVETFTYSVIVATVLLHGLSAGWVAGWLGLRRPLAIGWLIVGANRFAREVATFISQVAKVPVLLLDLNPKSVREARAAGLPALVADARDADVLEERPELHGIGNLLALTDNEDLNNLLCQRWADAFGQYQVLGWHSAAGASSVSRRSASSVVWTRLPRPSILSSNIDRARARLKVQEISAPKEAPPEGTLLMAGPNVVLLDPLSMASHNTANLTHALVLRRRTGLLIDALRPQLFLRSQTVDVPTLLKQLVDRFLELAPQLPAQQLVQELVEREGALPSVIGEGVAIPHAYNKAVSMRMCGLALVPDGLAVSTAEERPVRLVFLLIGPPGDPEGHLALIAEIAAVAADEDVRERLIKATSFGEVVSVIRRQLTDE